MPVSILLAHNQLTVPVTNSNQIPIDPVGNAFREKYSQMPILIAIITKAHSMKIEK